jgi:hypothetical protein
VWGNFEFSLSTANCHIRMYERFKDCPQLIRDKTIAEINNGKERVKREYNRIEEAGDSGSLAKVLYLDRQSVVSISPPVTPTYPE